MKYNTDKILDLCKERSYFSFLETELIKANKHFAKVYEIPLEVIKDNLMIGINSSSMTGKTVEDLKLLLTALRNINDDMIISFEVSMPNKGLRTIYLTSDLSKIIGQL